MRIVCGPRFDIWLKSTCFLHENNQVHNYYYLPLRGSSAKTSMGNYPYPSDYLTGGAGNLPPWPVRVACEKFVGVDLGSHEELLAAVREAAAVFYNASGALRCHSLPEDTSYDGIWDYQWCTELLCQVEHVACVRCGGRGGGGGDLRAFCCGSEDNRSGRGSVVAGGSRPT